MQKSIFTVPKLVEAKEGWYIYIRYGYDDNRKKKVYKADLNQIKDLNDRRYKANLLIKVLHDKLKEGWNPFDKKLIKEEETFINCLKDALDEKKSIVSPKTFSGYKGTAAFIKKATEDLYLDRLMIKDLKRVHIRSIMKRAKENRNWSNKAYNKHLNYLSALLTQLMHSDHLEYNPSYKIKRLPEEDSNLHRTATIQEHERLKNHLEDNHRYFLNFLKTEYFTGIRPKEILSIQLYMIDIPNREINLPAKITKSKTKNRKVIIDNQMLDLLLSMELNQYPKDFYLFGSFRSPGEGNVGKYIDFIPAPTRIKRDTATKRFKKIKDLLGINITMYSYKHKGADDKLKAGVNLDSIRHQVGHSKTRMTEIYAKEIRNVYKDDIINNSTEF